MHYVAEKYDQFESLILSFWEYADDFELEDLNEYEQKFMNKMIRLYEEGIETSDHLDELRTQVRVYREVSNFFTDKLLRDFVLTF